MDKSDLRRGSPHKVVDLLHTYGKQEQSSSFEAVARRWLRRKKDKCTCKRTLSSTFPIFGALRHYRPLKDLPGDVISGLTVGVMHIPQGMAFSALATLPPIVGLYVAFFSTLVYFFMGGSRQASFGVIAVTCLMMGSVLDREISPPDVTASHDAANNVTNNTVDITSEEDYVAKKIEMSAAVTFVSGAFMVVLGKAGCGFVTTFMPEALIRGFTTGAATHVTISQMGSILGIKIPRHNGPLKAIMTVIELCKHLPDTNWVPLVISIVSMVTIYVVKIHVNQRFSKRLKIPIPIELFVMILSIVISKYCTLHEDEDLKIVGDIPTGVPPPKFPDLSLAKSSISDGLIIGVVAFAQSVALAKTFAIKHGYNIDANQEMFAYGVCSVVSSIFSGSVAAASMARSIVQDGTGGKSQIASLVGCTVVLMVILFLGPLFYNLPICILSSVIIVNLRGMFRQFLLLKPYWKQSIPDLILFLSTYIAVVVIDVDIGLGVGVAVAVLSVVVRTQRAAFVELGQVDDLEIHKPIDLYDKTFKTSTTRILRFGSPLYFANAEIFQKRFFKLLGININRLKKQKLNNKEIPLADVASTKVEDSGPGDSEPDVWSTASPANLRHVILDLSGANFIDITGAMTLKKVIQDLTFVDIGVYVTGLPDSSYHVLSTTDVWKKCGDHFYVSINDALNEINTVSIHL